MRGWAASLALLCARSVHAEVLEALQQDDTCATGDCDLSLAQLRGLQESVLKEPEAALETKAGRSAAAADSAEFKRLRIVNGCNSQPMWIAHAVGAGSGPDQNVKILPGQAHDFATPSHLSATRFWPKMGCDESGHNCAIGSSGGPGQACQFNPVTGQEDYKNCAPPVDTKSFGENGAPCNPKTPGGVEMKGCDYVDISLVDGWTLPVKLDIKGDCRTATDQKVDVLDCEGLSLNLCPAAERLTAAGFTADLRAINPKTHEVAGCYSPCSKLLDTKWSNKERPMGRRPEESEVSPYCCPTPPQTPDSCRAGPITSTGFLKTVHEKCPGVYGYAYDDGMGLMRCSSATHYTVTFYCPANLPEMQPFVASIGIAAFDAAHVEPTECRLATSCPFWVPPFFLRARRVAEPFVCSTMGDADYEVDFEARNTFLHVTVRPTTAGPFMTRSRSWTPSTSSNHSSEQSIQSIPAGWLPATTSPAVVEVVEAGHEPGPQPALHQVFNLTSATSSSSKESSSQSFLSESKLREAVAAFREGGERQEEPDLDEELEYTYELPSRGSEGHFEGRCQPCRFIHLGDGCRNGFNCNFCHEEHETQGGKTHRPSKGVRSGYKRTVNQIVESDMPEEEKMEAYQRLAERSPYMRCLLKAVVPNIDELMKTRGEASSGPTSSGGQLPAPEPRVPGLQPQQEDKSPTKLSL